MVLTKSRIAGDEAPMEPIRRKREEEAMIPLNFSEKNLN